MKRIQVIGGVHIADAGTTTLKDMFIGSGTGTKYSQTLADGAITDTPTLYIPLHPNVTKFTITEVDIGYVDTANVNDLAYVYLLRDNDATDYVNQSNIVWVNTTTPIPETPTSAPGYKYVFDPPRIIDLADAGKLYFITNWTTAVLSVGSGTGEFFYLIVKGYMDSPN